MIRKFFASTFVLIFASLAAPLMFSWQTYVHFTDPEFYNDGFYKAAHAVFIDETTDFIEDKKLSFIKDDSEVRHLLLAAFTEKKFKDVLRDIVDQVWNQDLHGGNTLNLKIDFPAMLSENDEFYDALFTYLQKNLPVCSDEASVDVEPLSCFDKNLSKDDFQARVRSALDRELFFDLPNQSTIELPMSVETTIADFSDRTSGIVFSFYVSVLLLTLLLTALVIYRPWERVLSWLSATVFFTAIHLLILAGGVLYIISFLDGSSFVFMNITFGLIAKKLLYYYSIPIAILSLLAWILLFLRLRKQDKPI